ncbi:hypothetical protein [Virgisporangium aurantiacum]|uniref:Dolichyl-phosphate-mannose-protein mannosyltransferase n=1 Tax=Virgisporangium aurantiacum TaxID=175570 RepID=A0A8J3ZEU2_9ACTN|nr:hypothetical protein [Virgisporangium aurantiacum]GIJ60335.1 hypothetical protein Vau01_078510 [Virgisporangium aurantiacum]
MRPALVPAPYLPVAAGGFLFACLVAYRAPWAGDFGLHAAVVDELRQHLWRPADPMVRAHTGNPYNTPYTVLLGLVGLLTGLSGVDTLRLAAPVCFALLLFGLHRFVRVFSASPWAPAVALPMVLLLWGEAAPTWSGFVNLAGLPLIVAYPSTVALALTLCWWAYLWHTFDRPTPGRWAAAGGFLGVVAIVHPFTAVAAVLGAVALALSRLRSLRPVPVLAAVAVAAAVVLAWPYSNVIEVALAAGDLDGVHRPLYSGVLRTYGPPLLLGLPALVLRLRRDPLDPLAAMVALALAVVGAGWVSGHWALGRMWPVVLIAVQVAVAVELVAALRGRFRVLAGAWTVLVVAACCWSVHLQHANALAVARVDKPVTAFADRHSWITGRVGAGEVLLLDLDAEDTLWTARDLLGSGVRFVAPPWPDPTLPDAARRRADNRELLAAGTAEDRRHELLTRYDVRWVLDSAGTLSWPVALETVAGPGPARLIRLG